jgi:hypothetical protein
MQARSSKLRGWQGHARSEVSGEEPSLSFQLLVVACNPLTFLGLQIYHSDLSICVSIVFSCIIYFSWYFFVSISVIMKMKFLKESNFGQIH